MSFAITELGSVNYAGGANAASSNGSIITGSQDEKAGYWDGAGWHYLSSTRPSEGIACSADGEIICGYDGFSGGYWTKSTGVFTALSGCVIARGCSDDGLTIVGDTTGPEPAFWVGGVMNGVAGIGGAHGGIQACNADGSVMVGWADDAGSVQHAVKWTSAGATVTDLGAVAGTGCIAYGITGDASKIVGSDGDTCRHAFVWNAVDGVTILPRPGSPGTNYVAVGISDDGSRIAGVDNPVSLPAGNVAVYWQDEVYNTLPPATPTYGSELVANGGFVGGTAGWTLDPGFTYGSNDVVFLWQADAGFLSQTLT